jgi:predicted permease
MQHIIGAIAPVFLLILLGHVLRRGGIPSFEFWNLNDRLVYWVLFPALLFNKTATSNLSADLLGPFVGAILLSFAVAVAFGLVSGRLFRLDGPVAASLLQGVARHNTFIALAISERLLGANGLALAALATSALVLVTNVVIVMAVVGLVGQKQERSLGRAMLRKVSRNPLLIAILLGLLVNLSGSGPIPVLHDATEILGQAALPVVLLCVGANIRIEGMRTSFVPMLLAIPGKFLVYPVAMAGFILLFDLQGPAALVAMVYGAVPTATSSYTLARQLGGDAPLMAAIITIQTGIALVSVPITLYLARLAFF